MADSVCHALSTLQREILSKVTRFSQANDYSLVNELRVIIVSPCNIGVGSFRILRGQGLEYLGGGANSK